MLSGCVAMQESSSLGRISSTDVQKDLKDKLRKMQEKNAQLKSVASRK